MKKVLLKIKFDKDATQALVQTFYSEHMTHYIKIFTYDLAELN